MKKALFTIGFLFLIQMANAQCAMCKAVVESGGDLDKAEGLNSGILYLTDLIKQNLPCLFSLTL